MGKDLFGCGRLRAITSVRPYRTPMSQATALEVLAKESPNKIDHDIVQAWSSIVLGKPT